MVHKILKIALYLLTSIIIIFGLYYCFNGGLSSFWATTREISFWQAIEDLFVGTFKGIIRTFGGYIN